MKYFPALLFIFAICGKMDAQVNYVLNPSFENYSNLPYNFDDIKYAVPWNGIDTTWSPGDPLIYDPLCLPDYCNSGSLGTVVGVPLGGYYYHPARTGSGMVEVRMLDDISSSGDPIDERDYLIGKLGKPLSANKSYCVTFYVAAEQTSRYAIDHIGAYLDNGAIFLGQDSFSCAEPQTSRIPQIVDTLIITDTVNWVEIQGNFTATGGEQYITIGNFSDFAHTDKTFWGNSGCCTFYLIDDVSVIQSDAVADAGNDTAIAYGDSVHIGTNEEGMPCTWYRSGNSAPIGYSGGIWVKPNTTTKYIKEMDLCGNVTYDTVLVYVMPEDVTSISNTKEVSIFPNPTHNELIIVRAEGCEVKIFNFLGQQVEETIYVNNKTQKVNIEGLINGVYLVQVFDPKTGIKVVKQLVKE